MTGKARLRNAAWLAGAAIVVPGILPGALMPAAGAVESAQFFPPSAPMVLTRTVRRPLPDGAEVLSLRRYEIRIIPDGAGYRVDGVLIATDVQAPPSLQRLAALERARLDDGMFPMRLDAAGKLLPRETVPAGAASRKAVELALQHVRKAGLAPAEADKASAFIRQIGASSGRTAWPDDLFSPAVGQRRQTQTIPLPNGAQGQVEIDIDASAQGGSGLLASFSRTVTTRLGSDARVTEETWTLTAKS